MMIVTGQGDRLTAFAFLKECLDSDASLSKGTEQILKKLEQENYTWLVCQRDEQICGVLLYDENFRIALLMVHPDYRNKGAGTALLKGLIEKAEQMHVSRISVQGYGDLVSWFEKKGFDILEKTEGDIPFAAMEYLCGRSFLGKSVTVIVDRPYGSLDQRSDGEMTCSCGYVQQPVTMEDCDDIEARIVGVYEPRETFTGTVIGIIYHQEDSNLHLIVAPPTWTINKEEIITQIGMVEQYYHTRMILCGE